MKFSFALDRSANMPLGEQLFQLFEPFASVTPDVPAYTPNVWRRIWRQTWFEPDGGRFSGLLTWSDRVSTFLFWRGADGKSVHPDASFFPERRFTLAPGEAFAPSDEWHRCRRERQGLSRGIVKAIVKILQLPPGSGPSAWD